jgi:hypothetical protein
MPNPGVEFIVLNDDHVRSQFCAVLNGEPDFSDGLWCSRFAPLLLPRWTSENRPFPDTARPAISGVAIETSGFLLRGLLSAQVGLDLRAPAARSAPEHVRMMEQPIEQGRNRGGVAEQLPQSSTGRFEVSSVDARS